MSWIIGFFKTFFVGLFAGIGRFLVSFISPLIVPIVSAFSRLSGRLWSGLILLAAIGLFIGGFTVAINAAGAALILAAPPEYMEIGRMFLPSNTSLCISTLLAAKFAQIILIWKVRIAELLATSGG